MINIKLLAGVANSHQRFQQRINDVLFSFEVDFISYTTSPYWIISIYAEGVPIGLGLPLNPGADLLANQNASEFGRFIFVGEPATLDNLGVANNLVWIPE